MYVMKVPHLLHEDDEPVHIDRLGDLANVADYQLVCIPDDTKRDNVTLFDGLTTVDMPPERVLTSAIQQGLQDVLVIGELPDGELFVAASHSDTARLIYRLKQAEIFIMQE